MKLKAKRALLEAAVMVLSGVMIAVWIFTQTGDFRWRPALFCAC